MTPEIEATDINTPLKRLEQLADQTIELARLVATNIAACDELLTKLHQKNDQQINKALVVNPNTPTEILMKLAIAYPEELLTNPVWDLLLLSNPNFFVEMPLETICSLLTIDEFKQKWGLLVFSHREDQDFFTILLTKYTSLWNEWKKKLSTKKIHVSGCGLHNTNLSGANLSGVNLSGANLSGANLSGANLSGANLEFTYLKGSKIDATTKIDDKWRLVWEIVNHGAVGNSLAGANLRAANLIEANLNEANLENANLESAYLGRANLSGANLSEANLKEACLDETNLGGADLIKANLESAYLEGADLEHANLEGANLEGADLKAANLERANLEGANLGGVYMKWANLHEANLHRANLQGADLEGANLCGSKINTTTKIDDKWLILW